MRFISLFLFIISFGKLGAQIQEKANSNLIEPYCLANDFKFNFQNNEYQTEDRIYVCPKYLPQNLTIVDSDNNLISYSVSWTVNSTPNSSSTNNTIILDSTAFIDSKIKINAGFLDTIAGDSIELEVEIWNDLILTFREKANIYQYDSNATYERIVQDFPESGPFGTPWLFLPNEEEDKLEATISRKKGFYAVTNIESSNSAITIDPNNLSKGKELIRFIKSGSGENVSEILGCHSNIPELKVFSANKKEYEVVVYRLCETDDDIQVVPPGNTVTMATDVCVSGGDDFFIDQKFMLGAIHPNDSLILDSFGRDIVVAGSDLLCETKAYPNSAPKCPSSYNVQNAIAYANNVFGEIGITFINNIDSNLYFNYNILEENSTIELPEINFFYLSRRAAGHPENNKIEIYLVQNLGESKNGTVAGRAISLGGKALFLDVKNATLGTLTHEFGHAIWGLLHPEDDFKDPSLSPLNNYNFMHFTSTNRVDKVKAYQFNLIFN